MEIDIYDPCRVFWSQSLGLEKSPSSELLKGRPSASLVPPSLAASAVPARRRRAGGRDDDKGRAIPTRVLGGENEDEVGGTWRGDGEMEIEERGGTEMTELFD